VFTKAQIVKKPEQLLLRLFRYLIAKIISERLNQFFFNTSSLTSKVTQVIKLSLTNITTTLQCNAGNLAAMGLEGTLHTNTVRNFTYSKRRVQSAITLSDNYTFKCLQTLTGAFNYFYLYYNSVTRRKFGNF